MTEQRQQAQGAAPTATTAARPLGVRHAVFAIAVIIAAVLALTPAPAGADPMLMRAAAVTALAVGLYATGLLPEYLTSILYMFLAVLLALAPPAVAFSGFHSSAVWLVFGGLILGLGVQQSGLAARVVRLMLRYFPPSYFGTVAALAAVGALLGFVIPSAMGRVMVLLPIVLVLAERIGFAAGSRGRAGLVLAGCFGTLAASFAILPANVPNMGLIGGAESLYGIHFTYGKYLALNYPVMGALSLVVNIALITALFRETPQPAESEAPPVQWTRAERTLLLLVGAALALWATDFAHHIAPAWIAMGAAVIALMPRIGVVPPSVITNKINFGPWFFVAGVIGMGAVVKHVGLGETIAKGLLDVLPLGSGEGFATFATVSGLNVVVALVTTMPAAPAIMTPLAGTISTATGWPLETVLMLQVPTWGTFPLPYQAPPLVMAIAIGGLSFGQALRFLLPYFVIGIVVLLPIQYLWGRALGIYP
jgi:di/tricarboxylate transporter